MNGEDAKRITDALLSLKEQEVQLSFLQETKQAMLPRLFSTSLVKLRS